MTSTMVMLQAFSQRQAALDILDAGVRLEQSGSVTVIDLSKHAFQHRVKIPKTKCQLQYCSVSAKNVF